MIGVDFGLQRMKKIHPRQICNVPDTRHNMTVMHSYTTEETPKVAVFWFTK